MHKLDKLAEMILQAEHIVGFTGAGMSTESGIPDFRSAGGIYDRLSNRRYSGEEALSVGFLEQFPELFFQNFREKLDFPEARPNFGHQFFVKLEELGKGVEIVTQNIDHLHESAGSKAVWAVHGDATKWKVHTTDEPLDPGKILWDTGGIARNEEGQLVRPAITLYGEALDQDVFEKAWKAVAKADLLLVIGTGLSVYPAAGLLDAFQGDHAVLINRTAVSSLLPFDLTFHEDSGRLLEAVWEKVLQ